MWYSLILEPYKKLLILIPWSVIPDPRAVILEPTLLIPDPTPLIPDPTYLVTTLILTLRPDRPGFPDSPWDP